MRTRNRRFDVYRLNGTIKLHDLDSGEILYRYSTNNWLESAYTLRWIKNNGQLIGKNLVSK